MRIKFKRPFSLLALTILSSSEITAGIVQNTQDPLRYAVGQCISEERAKKTLEVLFKDFPSKESFLSFERTEDYRLTAPTLIAARAFLKVPPEKQLAWLAGYLPEAKLYYDDPKLKKWKILYQSAEFLDKHGEYDSRIYKQFPQTKECITGISVMSPDSACYQKQQLNISFYFLSGGENGATLLNGVSLSPLNCK